MAKNRQHSIAHVRTGNAVVAQVGGRVDSTNAYDFEQEVQGGLASSDEVLVLDCTELKYISSAGLRVALKLAKQFRSPRRFAMCGLSEGIDEIIMISGFNRIIRVFGTADEALAG